MLVPRSDFHFCCSLRALVILGGFLQQSRPIVSGHLNVTSRLLTRGERTPNYTPDLRAAADQLLPLPPLNCTFVMEDTDPFGASEAFYEAAPKMNKSQHGSLNLEPVTGRSSKNGWRRRRSAEVKLKWNSLYL